MFTLKMIIKLIGLVTMSLIMAKSGYVMHKLGNENGAMLYYLIAHLYILAIYFIW